MFSNETRIVNHSSTMKVILGAGGEIEDLKVKEKENDAELIYDTAIITNLSQDATIEDLQDLFD